jgi:heat shock protein beta
MLNCRLHRFFSRVDRVLRRSLGVSETAPTDTTVKPAPPVDPGLPEDKSDEEDGKPRVVVPDDMKDKVGHSISLPTVNIADCPVISDIDRDGGG